MQRRGGRRVPLDRAPEAGGGHPMQTELETPRERITFDDFLKVDIRVGRIVKAEPFPEARRPAYRLEIDFGPLGRRRSSAQITRRYRPEELEGRLVVAVVNFPPKQIANTMSEVLVLGAVPEPGDVSLLAPDHDVAPGTRIA
jgi:tRNA-binding protein